MRPIYIRGFTLIELIVTTVILGFIAAVTVPMFFGALDITRNPQLRANLYESANLALLRMSREIRRLKDMTTVLVATNAVYEFIDIDNTQIRYRQVANTLMRREGAAGIEHGLADQIQANGLTFIYYDDQGNVIPTPNGTNIRQIEIQITLQDGNQVLPVSVRVVQRNLPHDANTLP